MDRTLINGMLVKFFARIAMNVAMRLLNEQHFTTTFRVLYVFPFIYLNFVMPVRF